MVRNAKAWASSYGATVDRSLLRYFLISGSEADGGSATDWSLAWTLTPLTL